MPLPEESLRQIADCCSTVNVAHGENLYEEGQRVSRCYFLKNGLVRAYSMKDGKEVTFWFGSDGDVIYPMYTVMYHGRGQYETIEALEDTEFYEVDLWRMSRLFETDIHIANWGRCFAERGCINAEQMFIDRQFLTATERYEQLVKKNPEICRRVSLGIIASYLGISQVSLSRIRAGKQ